MQFILLRCWEDGSPCLISINSIVSIHSFSDRSRIDFTSDGYFDAMETFEEIQELLWSSIIKKGGDK